MEHGISTICFMAPYVVTNDDVDTPTDVMSVDTDELEEARSQAYHRRIEWAECKCGERFEGRRAHKELTEHIAMAGNDVHAITEIEMSDCRDGSTRYDITFAYWGETYTVEAWVVPDDHPAMETGIQVTFPEALDADSEMDELVMERKAQELIEAVEENRTE
jgi:hypothetical protein